jgi:hypothetical protein
MVEKAAIDAERVRNNAIMEQQQNADEELRFSPTLSIEQESVSSVNSVWPAVRLINFTKLQYLICIYKDFLLFSLVKIRYSTIVLVDFRQCRMKELEQVQTVLRFLKIYKHN